MVEVLEKANFEFVSDIVIDFEFEVEIKWIWRKERVESCFGEMLWWAARTSNPVDAAKRSGSIPPPERFYFIFTYYSLQLIIIL